MGQQKKISRLKHLRELEEPVIVDDGDKLTDEPIFIEVETELLSSRKTDLWRDFWTAKLWQGLIIAVLAAAIVGSLSSMTWRGS